MKKANSLYSLIQLEDFKVLMGIDDREDKLSRFCLVSATQTIERYCMRKFLYKRHTDFHSFYADNTYFLREYPVRKIIKVDNGEIVDPKLYYFTSGDGINEEIPYSFVILPPLTITSRTKTFRITYRAGYSSDKIPADLASACMELAIWNMNRYRGKKIGMTSNVRGKGRDGEHFEASMPENVRLLIEPYRRKTI